MIDFDLLKIESPSRIASEEDVIRDLELEKIISIASMGDELVAKTLRNVLLLEKVSPDSMKYRQDAVKDALSNMDIVQRLYKIVNDVLEKLRMEVFFFRNDDPVVVVHEVASGMEVMLEGLQELIDIMKTAQSFTSEAFKQLKASLLSNIDDDFLVEAKNLAEVLHFWNGIEFFLRIGERNSLIEPVLLIPSKEKTFLSKIISGRKEYVYKLDPRDEAGSEVVYDMERWVLAQIATTVLKAYEHLKHFFENLRIQLSFYIGAINLWKFFEKMNIPSTYAQLTQGILSFEKMIPLSLVIKGERPIPYDFQFQTNGGYVVVISGANRGGKTTFLKALGQSILLARAGLFVPAQSFSIPSTGAVYTHFLRKEDREFSYGKFEEEVRRFKELIKHMKRGDYVLMDESFSSTNQVEASVVAENVVSALIDSGIFVFYVTFLQDFIYDIMINKKEKMTLIVPERLENGTRTFRLIKGEVTLGYALDLWNKYID